LLAAQQPASLGCTILQGLRVRDTRVRQGKIARWWVGLRMAMGYRPLECAAARPAPNGRCRATGSDPRVDGMFTRIRASSSKAFQPNLPVPRAVDAASGTPCPGGRPGIGCGATAFAPPLTGAVKRCLGLLSNVCAVAQVLEADLERLYCALRIGVGIPDEVAPSYRIAQLRSQALG
jgi:hypothetical protein